MLLHKGWSAQHVPGSSSEDGMEYSLYTRDVAGRVSVFYVVPVI